MFHLTCDIRLQCFGHQAPGDPQVLRRTFSRLQSTGHAHTFQYLNVIMDLKHAVEVEEVLKSVQQEKKSTCNKYTELNMIYWKKYLKSFHKTMTDYTGTECLSLQDILSLFETQNNFKSDNKCLAYFSIAPENKFYITFCFLYTDFCGIASGI